ncbi:MAG: imidazoleglycerol-phosphate dehydratase HisB, partial [Chloroflexi bacterium]|nr:imidazoleglycerol-phosphate dehydratase HisB [Chloroflexota bacterium]
VQIEQIKELKTKYGYTDERIGQETGYSRQYINQILNGSVPLNPSISAKLSRLFPLASMKATRTADVKRKTRETDIALELNLDGTGEWQVKTDIPMFDHMLSQVVHHGRFDLSLTGTGDDPHHLVEDIAICLGKALNEALGEKSGIVRMGDATVPMDDALAMVAVDLSGRGYTVLELPFSDNDMAGFSTDLIRHFLESLAAEAKLNLHARIVYGINDHHKAEALFKALGRALDMATRIDERIAGKLPSTKKLLG